jgi:hypothetical protein
MIRLLPLLLLLAACTDPRAGIGIGIGPGGVTVNPVISGNVGGVGVSVSPAIR